MTLADRVRIRPDVMARRVGGETVILDLASGTYFGLDEVGTSIWGLLEQGHTLAEVCEAMLQTHDVERPRIEHDILDLVAALRERGLVDSP